MRLLFLLASVSAFLLVDGAQAQSLKVRQYQKDEDESVASELKSANQACGTTIAAQLDWSTFKQEAGWDGFSPSSYCSSALAAIRHVCDDADGKSAVQKSVKQLSCASGDQRAISLKDGKIDYIMNQKSSNDEDFVKDFLENHL